MINYVLKRSSCNDPGERTLPQRGISAKEKEAEEEEVFSLFCMIFEKQKMSLIQRFQRRTNETENSEDIHR